MIYAYLLLPFILAAFAYLLVKKTTSPAMTSKAPLSKEGKKWRIIIIATMTVSVIVLGMAMYPCWIQHDDWHFMSIQTHSLHTRLHMAWEHYSTQISRLPNVILYIYGMSESAWEKYTITPMVTAIAPVGMFMLCKRKGDSLYSGKGLVFYICTLCFCLVGVCMEPWRNYWCWAAEVVYIFPTVLTLFFLSYMRFDNAGKTSGKKAAILLFAVGVLCGWGIECLSVILCPLLILCAIYTLRKDAPKWSAGQHCGMLGFLFGTVMLFATPALLNRSASTRNSIKLDIAGMSPEELSDFVSCLTPEKVDLVSSGRTILLSDFPLQYKLHFIPVFIERYWSCCWVTSIALVLLLALFLVFRQEGKRKAVVVVGVLLFLSWLMALSYFQGAIPTEMSFLPPAFIIVLAIGYLLLCIKQRAIPVIFTFCSFAFTVYALAPSILEAWEFKKYEQIRFNEIRAQLAEGRDHIVLSYPLPKKPVNKLYMIGLSRYDFTPHGNWYPDSAACVQFRVKSFAQLPAPDDEAGKEGEKE